jgi:hypothetical protein
VLYNYRLNIDGVKRWLTLSNRRSRKSKKFLSDPEIVGGKSGYTKLFVDGRETSQLVTGLKSETMNDIPRILESWNELSQSHSSIQNKSQAYQAMYKSVAKLVRPSVTKSEEDEYKRFVILSY